MGDHGIDIQFVGTVRGAHPVVSGVAVGRGLDRLGGEGEKGQDRHRSQKQREDTAMAVMSFRVHSEPPEKIKFGASKNSVTFVTEKTPPLFFGADVCLSGTTSFK